MTCSQGSASGEHDRLSGERWRRQCFASAGCDGSRSSAGKQPTHLHRLKHFLLRSDQVHSRVGVHGNTDEASGLFGHHPDGPGKPERSLNKNNTWRQENMV
jgi:hypothetical protein